MFLALRSEARVPIRNVPRLKVADTQWVCLTSPQHLGACLARHWFSLKYVLRKLQDSVVILF